jgi:hypothetical protein
MVSNVPIISYQNLRRTIGYLGIFLPIVLVLLSWIPYFGIDIKPSISDYYYTPLRELFTGTLCAVGLFLFSYRGHPSSGFFNENSLTNLAGVLIYGVALFPMEAECDHFKIFSLVGANTSFWNAFHLILAGLFFIALAALSWFFFTKDYRNDGYKEPQLKRKRNWVYKGCALGILLSLGLIGLNFWLKVSPYAIILFEATSLWFFGISWLVKGKALGSFGYVRRKLYGSDAVVDVPEDRY